MEHFTMRYMYLVRSVHSGPPPQRLIEEIGKVAERARKAGTMIDTGGLLPLDMGGARVRLAGGKLDVIDGPFAESKEVIGGYAIFDFPTREEALASMVDFMTLHQKYGEGWEGECEMRPMVMPGSHSDPGCLAPTP
jgi:hypothetical protein